MKNTNRLYLSQYVYVIERCTDWYVFTKEDERKKANRKKERKNDRKIKRQRK